MRFFDGAAVDAALAYPALIDILEAAFSKGAIAPLRHHHAISLDGRPEATLLLMPAWEASAPGAGVRRPLPRRQDGHGVPRQRRARQAGRARHLSADVGRDRRDAGGDGCDAAHRLAHGRRLRAGQPLPLAPRCLAPADGRARGRWRRFWSARMPPCGRSARSRSGTARRTGAERWSPRCGGGLEVDRRRRPGGRRAPRRHRLDGDPLRRAADPRRVAGARHASRLRRRLQPSMRETDDEVVRRARIFVDTRAGAFARGRRHRAADGRRRDRQGGRPGRSVRSDPRHRGRARDAEEITFFKSVGAAIEDLAAAIAGCTGRRLGDLSGGGRLVRGSKQNAVRPAFAAGTHSPTHG